VGTSVQLLATSSPVEAMQINNRPLRLSFGGEARANALKKEVKNWLRRHSGSVVRSALDSISPLHGSVGFRRSGGNHVAGMEGSGMVKKANRKRALESRDDI
jgi:hypothetical protein